MKSFWIFVMFLFDVPSILFYCNVQFLKLLWSPWTFLQFFVFFKKCGLKLETFVIWNLGLRPWAFEAIWHFWFFNLNWTIYTPLGHLKKFFMEYFWMSFFFIVSSLKERYRNGYNEALGCYKSLMCIVNLNTQFVDFFNN
jgi:hypothetical protein